MPGLTERDAAAPGLEALLRWVRPTFAYAENARPTLEIGYFANVVPVAPNLGVAISTDGVGTKLLVAQAAGRFDTVGIDCVAMNVNDVLCVGARPLALVDYVALDDHVPELGCALADELLRPTRIYVRPVLPLLAAGLPIRALAHLTGDGLFNLARTVRAVGFDVERWPEVPPIFGLVQRLGGIADEEMYRAFNMGVGFALVVAPEGVDRVSAALAEAGLRAHVLGRAVDDPERSIHLRLRRLVGRGGRFTRA